MNKKLFIKNKYWRYFPLRFFFEKGLKNMVHKTISRFEGFINENDKVLDVGTGCGWNAQYLKEKKNVQVALLDVIDFNQTDLKLVLYDGKKIPFPDNSFDAVLLIYVLHHCNKPLEILKEAKRVTKDRIIIMENTFASWFEKPLPYFWDTVINLGMAVFLITPFKENMAFNFNKISKWEKMFNDLDLKLISKQEWFQFRRDVCFILRKENFKSF